MVATVRQEWADGHRRFESSRDDPGRHRALQTQLEAVTEQLRRRLGGVFTLAELVGEYRRADSWARDLITELPPPARWVPGLTTATDAAFHLFARGAQDYEP